MRNPPKSSAGTTGQCKERGTTHRGNATTDSNRSSLENGEKAERRVGQCQNWLVPSKQLPGTSTSHPHREGANQGKYSITCKGKRCIWRIIQSNISNQIIENTQELV